MDRNELNKQISENAEALQEYAEVASDSYSNECFNLIVVAWNASFLSDEFKMALNEEIKFHLEYYRKTCKIVEKEKTITRKYQYLEWYDEENCEED